MNLPAKSYTNRDETTTLVDETVCMARDAVCCTMGPNARLALIIDRNESVLIRDGVRVAKALDFSEDRRNAIARLITSAAIKTDELVGDGTTTTVFMVHALHTRFKGLLDFKTSAHIAELVKETKSLLGGMITEVSPLSEEFVRMVYTTTNYQGDIADTIIALFQKYRAPKVTLVRGMGHPHDVVEVKKNIVFDGRYATSHLQPNTPRSLITLNQPTVLVVDGMINTLTRLQTDAMIDVVTKTHQPFVVVARHFEPGIADTFIAMNAHINTLLGALPEQHKLFFVPYIVNASGSAGADIFKDLGRLLGISVYSTVPTAEVITTAQTHTADALTLDMYGIQFDKEDSVIKDRSDSILKELEPVFDTMTITERANLLGKLMQNRIGRLRAENVTITVSGMTDAEISERYYLFEDAARVAETSLRFGVIPGIGYGFNQAAEHLYKKHIVDGDNLTDDTRYKNDITELYCAALTSQYEYLTGEKYVIGGDNKYLDLVRDEYFSVPEFVFDNGCAAMCAIEAAWSVVKGLGKTAVILGKNNRGYDL